MERVLVTGFFAVLIGFLIFATVHDIQRDHARKAKMEECVRHVERISDANQTRWLELCAFQYRWNL